MRSLGGTEASANIIDYHTRIWIKAKLMIDLKSHDLTSDTIQRERGRGQLQYASHGWCGVLGWRKFLPKTSNVMKGCMYWLFVRFRRSSAIKWRLMSVLFFFSWTESMSIIYMRQALFSRWRWNQVRRHGDLYWAYSPNSSFWYCLSPDTIALRGLFLSALRLEHLDRRAVERNF